MSQIKNCPFCGGTPEKATTSLDERYGYAKQVTYRCKSCGCERSAVGDTSKPGYADNSTVDDRAFSAWNRRAPVEQAPEWKLVPVEPTDDMIVAFAEAWFSKVRPIDDCGMEDAYTAMLAAAPSAPGREG